MRIEEDTQSNSSGRVGGGESTGTISSASVQYKPLVLLGAIALMFLSYQLYLSWALWQRTGNIPPGFDDSYSYIFDIGKVVEYQRLLPPTTYPPRYSHLKDLSYNYLMASMTSLSGSGPERVYRLSFFAGKVVLLLVVLRLLMAMEKDSLVLAGMLAALAPFSGTPEFHGFYWVVPSFWLLCLFFFWMAVLAGASRLSGPVLLATGFLGGTVHALGPYLVAPLGMFLLALRVLHRKDEVWRSRCRSFFWIGAGALIAASIPNLLATLPQYGDIRAAPPHAVIWLGGGWPDLDSEGSAAADARTVSFLPGYAGVWRSYLRFVLSPVVLVAVVLALGLLVVSRRWLLLSLFIATLTFTLATTVHPYASRTCLFLWPSTLMILGAAPALGWRLVQSRLRRPTVRIGLASAALSTYFVLFAVWHAYNRTLIQATLRFSDARWDETCAAYVLERTSKSSIPVFYGSKYTVSALLTRGLDRRQALPLSELPDAVRRLHPGQTVWAVVDAPGSGLPLSEDKYRVASALQGQGIHMEQRDCGVFAVLGYSGQ